MDNAFKQLASISKYQPRMGDLLELFTLLNQGMDRQDAKAEFLQRGKSEEYFKVLYNRLEGRMMQGVLLNSFKDYASFRKQLIKLNKEFSIVQILILSDNKLAGIPKAEKLCTKLEKYGLLQHCISIALDLENIFATSEVNYAKYHKYRNLVDKLKKEWEKEYFARRVFAELAFSVNKKKAIEYLKPKLDILEELFPSPYFLFNLYYFSVKNLYHRHHTKDQELILAISKRAMDFFRSFNSPLPYTTEWNFARQVIPPLIQKGDYYQSEAAIRRCIKLADKDSYNGAVSLLYLALLGFHSKKPKITENAYRQATGRSRKFKSEEMEQRWWLIRAYIEVCGLLGMLHIKEPLKWGKFLNSVPFLESDKGRNNVAIIIVDLLYHLFSGNFEIYGDLAARLPYYWDKHLKGPKNARVRYFLRLLHALYDGNYHPIRFERRARQWELKLKHSDMTISVDIAGTEVLPFEWIWNRCKEKLSLSS